MSKSVVCLGVAGTAPYSNVATVAQSIAVLVNATVSSLGVLTTSSSVIVVTIVVFGESSFL